MNIVDVHTHIFPVDRAQKAVNHLEDYYGFQVKCQGILAELEREIDKANLDKAILNVVALIPESVQCINNWLMSLDSSNLIKFGALHPEYKNLEEEVARLKKAGIKGIKLHADFQNFDLLSEDAYAMYEALGEDFVILFHIGDNSENLHNQSTTPSKLAQVIEDFTDLKVIAAHLGGFQMWAEAKKSLIGKDIYIDTSNTYHYLSNKEMESLIKEHGIDKVLFGSDYPLTNPATAIQELQQLELTSQELEKILGQNALDLLAELDVDRSGSD
ncbi:amidohydrolase family protein [Fuchsiella alkaliacetigena]|uniref:amidohydrolase family protein n=1 Tax=Fuchsiella alkaliacetigena TaxID=957042 RepID=UPI00200B5401|nr:amidohydrolase family protein [Fuchsiella alkaliacetigena]MCK8825113.1 amidohydrolase family protein [Fuchsiella alkaliacetigena]